MLFRKQHLYLLVVIFFILSLSGTALAIEKFNIKPKISANWKIDNNFFKSETNEREVYTYLLQPGFDFGFETAKSLISLSYTMNYYKYNDQDSVPAGSQSADENDYTGHRAIFKAGYKAFERLKLGLYDFYNRTRDPADSDSLSNSISREKYSVNQVLPWIAYELGPKLSAGLKYRYKEKDYDDVINEDSEENRVILKLAYNLKPKMLLNLEYQTWKMNYNLTSSDYDSDQIKLIFMKQFNYFSFEAGGGYQNRGFDDNAMKDIDLFTYKIAIMGQNPPAPDMNPNSYITLAVEQNFNDLGEGQQYFKAQRFTLKAGHTFMEKIIASAEGYYQNSDYEATTGATPSGAIELREDQTYNLSGSLGYKFTDWLTFSLTTGYEDRNSNLAGFDYSNRYYMAKVDFSYNPGSK
ncbi:MAG: outer membrane beta-barrel protein [Thermodesulfobacteriota bacterium]|nr:outer membrane beta-barrel protein [Thermodesulfobacteriota bacterium]